MCSWRPPCLFLLGPVLSAPVAGCRACLWPGLPLHALFLRSAHGSNAGHPVLGQHLQGPRPNLDPASGSSGNFFGNTNPAAASGLLSSLSFKTRFSQQVQGGTGGSVHALCSPRGQAPAGDSQMWSLPPFSGKDGDPSLPPFLEEKTDSERVET